MILSTSASYIDLDSFINVAQLKRSSNLVRLVERKTQPAAYPPLDCLCLYVGDHRKVIDSTLFQSDVGSSYCAVVRWSLHYHILSRSCVGTRKISILVEAKT